MEIKEPLLRRTSKAATRLLKSKIREHVYETNRMGAEDDRWSAMLLIEEGFIGPALREWNEVLALWGDLSNEDALKALKKVISDCFVPAASEVLASFDASDLHATREIIKAYHKTFKPDDLIQRTNASG